MKIDSIALTARGKVICQDVARHGKNYIIVADGCSSSPHSEVGAMLLAMTARKFIIAGYFPQNFSNAVIQQAWKYAGDLGLPCEAMDATLIVGYDNGNKFRVLVCGDGAVWIKTDSEFDFFSHETFGTSGEKVVSLPYYPSYELNEKRKASYFSGGIQSFVNGSKKDFIVCREYDFEKTGIIGISTDGISAITGAAASKITVELALSKFIDFPITEGAFLARRAWATLNREKWILNDDFGMAVVIWK